MPAQQQGENPAIRTPITLSNCLLANTDLPAHAAGCAHEIERQALHLQQSEQQAQVVVRRRCARGTDHSAYVQRQLHLLPHVWRPEAAQDCCRPRSASGATAKQRGAAAHRANQCSAMLSSSRCSSRAPLASARFAPCVALCCAPSLCISYALLRRPLHHFASHHEWTTRPPLTCTRHNCHGGQCTTAVARPLRGPSPSRAALLPQGLAPRAAKTPPELLTTTPAAAGPPQWPAPPV